MAERQALLAEYRRALDRALSEGEVPKPAGNPKGLIGLPRGKIRLALGDPHECRGIEWPCQARGDWFYSFYKMGEGEDGGGLELLLRFDRTETCSEARWEYSE